MREQVFTIDGDLLSWEAQDGEVFFELVSVDKSRSFRWVWEPEQLADILFDALMARWATLPVDRGYRRIPSPEGVLGSALKNYLASRVASEQSE